jgi:hypothetical protein
MENIGFAELPALALFDGSATTFKLPLRRAENPVPLTFSRLQSFETQHNLHRALNADEGNAPQSDTQPLPSTSSDVFSNFRPSQLYQNEFAPLFTPQKTAQTNAVNTENSEWSFEDESAISYKKNVLRNKGCTVSLLLFPLLTTLILYHSLTFQIYIAILSWHYPRTTTTQLSRSDLAWLDSLLGTKASLGFSVLCHQKPGRNFARMILQGLVNQRFSRYAPFPHIPPPHNGTYRAF